MIILLNGTSSSGKTTIGKLLQEKYQGILLLYGVDIMVQGAFPAKCDYPPLNEQAIKVRSSLSNGQPLAKLEVSPYMYPVYRSAVQFYKMLSAEGYNLIIDELLFDENRVTPYFEILQGEVVYFIAIKPSKAVVIERELQRGDRLPGLAAGLYDEVYNPLFSYDLTLDSGKLTPDECAEKILEYVSRNPKPHGFIESRLHWFARPTRPTRPA